MKEFNQKSEKLANKAIAASWNYESNITDHNSRVKNEILKEVSKEKKAMWKELQRFNWKNFKSADLKRQFTIANNLGSTALPDDKFKEFIETTEAMSTIYSKATVCDFNNKTNCELRLEPDLTEAFAKLRDPEALKHYWSAWRDASGKKCRQLYLRYIELKKAEAKANSFDDPVKYWNFDFESDTFETDIMKLWEQLQPFYQQLHGFVRDKLYRKYGENVVSRDGPIPAHLLGNMWGQSWGNINDIVNPFYGRTTLSATQEMLKQGYTPLKMAKLSEDFFKSINLTVMPKEFWERSILEQPKDRDIVCHASAWDLQDGDDVRIKMCTEVNEEELGVMHHEMGHIEYFLQYKGQPHVYREGANSGFHEAIGDTIALNVVTDKHMSKIGLKPAAQRSKEDTINSLLETSLDKIAFLPFGFLIDQYRWDVLRGVTNTENLECAWWKLREKYQGLEPPVDRSEADFDPAAKYHIVSDVPYVRYFVSFVIQFQFYKALCVEAGQYNPSTPDQTPLHECDIYGNTAAGNLLGKMLQMGSSKPWQDAMEVITGQRNMDAGPLMEYFKPLIDWLTEENKKHNVPVGWKPSKRHSCSRKG
ncbi:Angiotensin-converting enzyme [Nesidiocoris tenuis]|uniref:Angiotensin-converting enzyme n=1 Tax=Nesidiocoris tenuis TaxID=355587 RepID=A0ABN7AWV5_9HEMI|nr:Angiotensin-converting enzyme [Nesidiocoris tenuis]